MKALVAIIAIVLSLASMVEVARAEPIIVGSKKFTESVILGEIVTVLARHSGAEATHTRELGGTRLLWNALVAGEIDVYPEYTGTLREEILAKQKPDSDDRIEALLAGFSIRMSRPLGFNNTYAIGLPEELAADLDIKRISDLRDHPHLRFGFGNEFMQRNDGWPSLRRRYRLFEARVRGLDHDLAYRALSSGTLDAMDMYSTDAEIDHYGMRVLEDDLSHFPDYQAVLLYRDELAHAQPRALDDILLLEDSINDATMRSMNAAVKLQGKPEAAVAVDFSRGNLEVMAAASDPSQLNMLVRHTKEHLTLVAISLSIAVLVAIPLGIIAAKFRRSGRVILAVTGVIQTIPSLALLVFMIPLLGIGGPPAIVALFLYSLLPIVRNTYAGIIGISSDILESAEALGLPAAARLRLVELPLASRAILAGIKTSAVINVGTATLGALIGAGGYGQPILTGIRLDDTSLILQGAVPAAVLALLAQWGFDLAEHRLVPKGLRLQGETRT